MKTLRWLVLGVALSASACSAERDALVSCEDIATDLARRYVGGSTHAEEHAEQIARSAGNAFRARCEALSRGERRQIARCTEAAEDRNDAAACIAAMGGTK